MTDEKTPTAFRTCTLSKGRGSSVTAYIVPSNHNDPIKGEVQLKIDNQVDLATLEEILLNGSEQEPLRFTLEGTPTPPYSLVPLPRRITPTSRRKPKKQTRLKVLDLYLGIWYKGNMINLRVYLYYAGKGEIKLGMEGPPWTASSLKEYLSQVKTGTLSLFGGETRDLTRDEVLHIVTPALVKYLPSESLTQIRLMYLGEPTYFRTVIGERENLFFWKTRFERMLDAH